ncbi:DUF3800 domain-containing protein [Corallococcus sp. ZKHCc1 1396]|uniref:DUF3800 domain-containing protein n=1 Tax=Corallococcus soli TaxID=2710757 RepID=A0ABR9PVF3_9BACT|nr:DUF3800 domain-containing protein [Corallococcus soli]MBE4751824.1 DUF3800 domain-containing protein [Corallococcus soli]
MSNDAKTLFVDESGFTGEDLFNKDQQVFVLATHSLSEEECRDFKAKFFGKVQATELKHSELRRNENQREMVLSALRELAGTCVGRIKCAVVHKKYAIVGKIVDYTVEPCMRLDGEDLYLRGGNIALANMMHSVLPVFIGADFFEKMLKLFQVMMRTREPVNYRAFFRFLADADLTEDARGIVSMIEIAQYKLGFGYYNSLGKNSLDVSLTSALGLMARWRHENPIPNALDVIHDSSSKMSKQKHIWDALVDPGVPPAMVGYDRRVMTFPLALRSTRFEPSPSYAGLQIADVVAGAVEYALSCMIGVKDNEYGRELLEVLGGVNFFVADQVWPRREVSPEEMGTDGEKHGDILGFTGGLIEGAEKAQEGEGE